LFYTPNLTFRLSASLLVLKRWRGTSLIGFIIPDFAAVVNIFFSRQDCHFRETGLGFGLFFMSGLRPPTRPHSQPTWPNRGTAPPSGARRLSPDANFASN